MEYFAGSSPEDANEQLIKRLIRGVYTHLPGIIVSFNKETMTAKVQPAIQSINNTEAEPTYKDLPELIEVPVYFPYSNSSGFSMTHPVRAGDECLLMFCQKSIDNWHDNGKTARPVETKVSRSHNISDAVCMVGISSKPNVIQNITEDGMEMRNHLRTSRVTIKDLITEVMNTLVVNIQTAVGDTILLSGGVITITPALGQALVVGDLNVTGDVIANVDGSAISLLHHKHGGVTGGPSLTGEPE